MASPLRILFMGTPEFAVPSLRALLDFSGVRVIGVITQPDRPAGRGLHLVPPPVKSLAVKAGIPLIQPQRLKNNDDALRFCRDHRPDLGVVVAFGQILPRSFFELPTFGTLNVHASLLPKYRGAAPLEHAILNGESETGVTIMRIDEGLDSGDLLTSRSIPLDLKMTAGQLGERAALVGAALLIATVPDYVAGRIQPQPQDDELATYAPRLEKEQARIDFNRPAVRVHNQIRAFNPRPGAFCLLRGGLVKIWSSEVSREARSDSGTSCPGSIVRIGEDGIVVRCVEGLLCLIEMQQAGRRRLPAADFIHGTGLRVGERFT